MNQRMARLATRLYPHWWRERYGEEFEALLMSENGALSAWPDVAWSALKERFFPTLRPAEGPCRTSFASMVKRPMAIVPMAMSAAALGVVMVHIAMAGVARQADEGAAAHSWQLLMATQLPLLLFFAIQWLPKAPRQAFGVMALQAIAAVAAMVPVFLLRW